MKKLLSLMLVLSVYSSAALADLMISPLYVLFDGRDRVQTINLINSGNQARTYRLGWTEQKVDATGSYVKLNDETVGDFPTASPFLRFSPSQVTLGPGERQAVKVMVRKPKDLAAGDYRSHLNFILLPPENTAQNDEDIQGVQMKLNVMLSYSIPVVLRQGEFDFKGQVNNIDITQEQNDRGETRANIVVNMSRAGISTANGRLEAYFTPVNSNRAQKVGILNNFNFFPDSPQLSKNIVWQNFNGLQPGVLEVKYVGEKNLRDQVLLVGKARIQ